MINQTGSIDMARFTFGRIASHSSRPNVYLMLNIGAMISRHWMKSFSVRCVLKPDTDDIFVKRVLQIEITIGMIQSTVSGN